MVATVENGRFAKGRSGTIMTLLDVQNLTTHFFTEDGIVHAVNDISFTLERGESMAIVGESGSGKSVTALSIMGLVPSPPGKVISGKVLFNGNDLLTYSERQMRQIRGREIGMIFQDPMTSLNTVLPIGRQLIEGMQLHENLSKEKAKKRAVGLLNIVGIPNAAKRLNDYPHQFSGGQRQRILIAMALACKPSLLIADEPTTALDVSIQAQIVELVNNIKDKLGMAVIWITHDLGVVASLVDKVAVLYAGQIAEIAAVHDLYKNTSHPYTAGLLASLPKIDQSARQRLIPIEGQPPNMLTLPDHCAFAPRCRFAVGLCRKRRPELEAIDPDHMVACFQWDAVQADNAKKVAAGVGNG